MKRYRERECCKAIRDSIILLMKVELTPDAKEALQHADEGCEEGLLDFALGLLGEVCLCQMEADESAKIARSNLVIWQKVSEELECLDNAEFFRELLKKDIWG